MFCNLCLGALYTYFCACLPYLHLYIYIYIYIYIYPPLDHSLPGRPRSLISGRTEQGDPRCPRTTSVEDEDNNGRGKRTRSRERGHPEDTRPAEDVVRGHGHGRFREDTTRTFGDFSRTKGHIFFRKGHIKDIVLGPKMALKNDLSWG